MRQERQLQKFSMNSISSGQVLKLSFTSMPPKMAGIQKLRHIMVKIFGSQPSWYWQLQIKPEHLKIFGVELLTQFTNAPIYIVDWHFSPKHFYKFKHGFLMISFVICRVIIAKLPEIVLPINFTSWDHLSVLCSLHPSDNSRAWMRTCSLGPQT